MCKFRLFQGFTKEASVPLSRLREVRFGEQASGYRISLQISQQLESKFFTLIYSIPSNSSVQQFKLAHFIAPTIQALELWKTTLEKFKQGRLAKPISAGDHNNLCDVNRVVKEEEVHQICARLGTGMSKQEVEKAFRVSKQNMLTNYTIILLMLNFYLGNCCS